MSSNTQFLLRLAEKWAPVLKNSKFKETGVLTPEEFVAAGEFLVYKCPTWSWQAGEESKRRPYLPADKQYLVTKGVPCHRRVKEMEYQDSGEKDLLSAPSDDADESWVSTHNGEGDAKGDAADAADLAEDIASAAGTAAKTDADDDDINPDDIPDMDAVDLNDNLVEEEEDPAVLKTVGNNNAIVKNRTYDLSITYDKYYQTPRVWLYGYDEQNRPLKTEQIYEDISQDHAKKTVTIEPHPHLSLSMASIHPCKHANVMKRIIDHLVENGKDLRVDQYMILFVKFLSAIIPTIEYDYTISMDG